MTCARARTNMGPGEPSLLARTDRKLHREPP